MDKNNQDIKICSACDHRWRDLDDFLHDDKLIFNGYQPFYERPDKGSFMFTHNTKNCGTTLSVDIWKFQELLEQKVEFKPFKPREHSNCELRCVEETDLNPCAVKDCNGNIIRSLIQIIKRYIRTPSDALSAEEIDRIIDGDDQ